MKLFSNYFIEDLSNHKVMIVSDENPQGVTITIKETKGEGNQESINMPRMEAIEVLEYILMKIKARELPKS